MHTLSDEFHWQSVLRYSKHVSPVHSI